MNSHAQYAAENENNDPLLACLHIIADINDKPFSPQAATFGLPLVDDQLTPSLFVRAAERIGFATRLLKKPVSKVSKLVLPAVLILESNRSCVLKQRYENGSYEVVFPGSDQVSILLTEQELEDQYGGFIILIHPISNFDERADEFHAIRSKSWFWGTLLLFKKIYIQVGLAAIFINLFGIATPMFVMNVYDRVVPNHAKETLWVLAVGIMIVFVFDFVFRTLRSILIDTAGKKVDVLLASRLFSTVLGMRLEGRSHSPGAFANHLREFEMVRDFTTSATLVTLIDIPFVFLFILFIALLSDGLAWIPLVALPIVVISTLLLEKPMQQAVERAQLGATQKHAVLVESMSSLEALKGLASEGWMQTKWERFVAMTAEASVKSRFFSSTALHITLLVQQLVTVLIVVAGVYHIAAGTLTIGGLIASTILSGRALAPLSQITNLLTRFEQSRMALKNLTEVMNLPQERPMHRQFLHRPQLNGKIECENLDFLYPGQPIPALQSVSFTIEPGEHVAFVGRVGSGKSTLLKLLLGLYPPSEGTIRIDGTDIAQIDPADLRHNMGYVAQDSPLFYGTIRENLTMGISPVSDEVLLDKARLSGVDAFVSRHPAGYERQLGERGQGLSGGQRQAVAICRNLIADTPIYILDEPTGGMDNSSEQVLIKALPMILSEKTVLVASHRASLLNWVDRIIVVDSGRIVADGDKETILQALQGQPLKGAGEGKKS